MPRFPFSIAGRKKQPVEPPAAHHLPPLSSIKARKILGSTPPDFEAPADWDDALSSVASDGRSANTSGSHTESDRRTDEHADSVIIAGEDEPWGEEFDMIPHPLRLNAVNLSSPTEPAQRDMSASLRKSHSSSMIRSWYDKTRLPSSISQQASSSAMAKGPPPNSPLDPLPVMNEGMPKTKRKPAPLEIPRTKQEEHKAMTNGPHTSLGLGRILHSPSSFFPFAPKSPGFREARRLRRRNTKESLQSSVPETPCSANSGSDHHGLGQPEDLPPLYGHDEQLPTRRILRQNSTPNLTATSGGRLTLEKVAEGPCEDEEHGSPQIHQYQSTVNIPETPKAAVMTKFDWQLSPGGTASIISSRHTKTSRGAERALGGKDLLRTSVLALSSDSEDDSIGLMEYQGPALTPRKGQVVAGRAGSLHNESRQGQAQKKESDENKTQCTHTGGQKKGTCSAAGNAYSPIPSPDSGRATTPRSTVSRSIAPYGDASRAVASSKISIISGSSGTSAATWEDESGYGVQTARAIAMLPARRASEVEMGPRSPASPSAAGRASKPLNLHRAPTGAQLTPPLSPPYVDPNAHSAHSSIEGTGRLMAVTHQEAILLSVLRHKQTGRPAPSNNFIEEEELLRQWRVKVEQNSRGSKHIADHVIDGNSHKPKATQSTIAGAPPDLGSPPQSSFRKGAKLNYRRTGDSRMLSAASIRSPGFSPTSSVMPLNPSGPPPTMSLPELPKGRKPLRYSPSYGLGGVPSQKEDTLPFDEAEPSPDMDAIRDWESATTSAAEPRHTPDALRTIPWQEDVQSPMSGNSSHKSPTTDFPAFFHPFNFPRRDAKKQEQGPHDPHEAAEDFPSLDSPISPGTLPPMPAKLTARTHIAQLSAVGPSLLDNV